MHSFLDFFDLVDLVKKEITAIDNICGCRIGYNETGLLWIEYCPLHDAAPELLNALKDLTKQYIKDREKIQKALKAINQAEKK